MVGLVRMERASVKIWKLGGADLSCLEIRV